MSRHIGTVLDRFVHLEPIILHRFKVLHVLEHNAFPVDPRLALELQICLISVGQLGLNNVARLADFDWPFPRFYLAPLQTIRLGDHWAEWIALLFRSLWI